MGPGEDLHSLQVAGRQRHAGAEGGGWEDWLMWRPGGTLERLGYQQCEESCRWRGVADCGLGGSPCLWCLWSTAKRFVKVLKCGTTGPPQPGWPPRRRRRRNTESRVRFARWQKTTITQFGFLTNTVLVLTTASVGFAFNHAFDHASTLSYELKCALIAGIASLGLSGFFALLCSWNRLLDFRLTTQIVRASEQHDLEKLTKRARITTRELGDQSWCLLGCQLFTFGVGILIVAVTLFCSLWNGNPA